MDIFDEHYEDDLIEPDRDGLPLIQYASIADPDSWPKADSSKLCLFEATNLVGRAIFGAEWTNEELLVRLGLPGPDIEPLSDADLERWKANGAAMARLLGVAGWIAQRSRDGALTGYIRHSLGGQLRTMPAHAWNVERPLPEFWRFGGPDLRNPVNARRYREQVYLFLDRAELGLAMARLTKRSVAFEEVRDWCHQWISEGRGNGMDPAWKVLKGEPRFRGVSRNFFRDAWNDAKQSMQ